MLIRIVRMTFEPSGIENFLTLFDESKDKIRNFPGCTHLELLRDFNEDHIFSTYSIWESEEHLNAYRQSTLFAKVWAATKAGFSDKPIAFSLKKFIEVK